MALELGSQAPPRVCIFTAELIVFTLGKQIVLVSGIFSGPLSDP
jgi:hypothetical protein